MRRVAVKSSAPECVAKIQCVSAEDGAGPRVYGTDHFETRTLGIFVPAAKRDAAFRQIFADRDFFLKPSTPDARKPPAL